MYIFAVKIIINNFKNIKYWNMNNTDFFIFMMFILRYHLDLFDINYIN